MKDVWKIHHNNAPNHISIIVSAYLDRLNIRIVPYSPYNLECSPFFFPRLKSALYDKRIISIEDIQENVKNAVEAIREEAYVAAFES